MRTSTHTAKSFILLLICLLPLFVACNQGTLIVPDPTTEPPITQSKYQFTMPTISESSKPIEIKNIDAFLFKGNTLVERIDNVGLVDNTCELSTEAGNTAYFLVNASDATSLQLIETGKTTLTQFLALRNNTVATGENPQLFYSGNVVISNLKSNVTLARSVARVDLDASRDDAIKVNRITFEEASSSTTLFGTAGNPAEPTQIKARYDKIFSPAISSTEAVQYLYETNKPVKIAVYATYNDIQAVVNFELPKIERNKVYTIKLEGLGATIYAKFAVAPWEDGGTVGTIPGQISPTKLSAAHSTLIEGVKIDEERGVISVSKNGGDFTLAFLSDVPLDLGNLSGGGYDVMMPFTPTKVESKDGKVISHYNVRVMPQGKGRMPFTSMFEMKRTNDEYSYDRFAIVVEGSDFVLHNTTIGGVTWMAFNATSPNLNEQIFAVDGFTVDQMYDRCWDLTLGGLFQFGKKHQYAPWEVGRNNAGNQTANNPWVAATHTPCPEGYRVPTRAEIRALLPPGTTFPGTYTYNGEEVTATINTAQVADVIITGVSGKARYLTIKSNTTGAKLHIPLGGRKGDKSGSNDPQFGAGFSLWTANTCRPGGWASTGHFWPGLTGDSYTIAGDDEEANKLQAEGFCYVRCVKQ